MKEDYLLIVVLSISRTDCHFEVTDDFEAARLTRVDRKQCIVHLVTIVVSSVLVNGYAKEFRKKIGIGRRFSSIPVLDKHNTQAKWLLYSLYRR